MGGHVIFLGLRKIHPPPCHINNERSLRVPNKGWRAHNNVKLLHLNRGGTKRPSKRFNEQARDVCRWDNIWENNTQYSWSTILLSCISWFIKVIKKRVPWCNKIWYEFQGKPLQILILKVPWVDKRRILIRTRMDDHSWSELNSRVDISFKCRVLVWSLWPFTLTKFVAYIMVLSTRNSNNLCFEVGTETAKGPRTLMIFGSSQQFFGTSGVV